VEKILFRSALLLALFVASVSAKIDLVVPDAINAIDSQYIVVFRDGVTDSQRTDHVRSLHRNFTSGRIGNIISEFAIGDFKGFSAKLPLGLLELQLISPLVQYVEQDAKVTISQTCTSQNGATWGLNRISERVLNLDGIYKYGNTGAGVDSYIVDTGILTTHVDFGGRAIWGANFADNTNTDCNGHGTHVAGTVGSTTYGVAKKTTLIAVKVLDCNGSGTNSGVISGINWVVSSKNTRQKPSVANMSLGGGKSTALNNAVAAAITKGVPFVVAAGNEDQDACNTSPASVSTAITVGATGTDQAGNTQVDNRAYFSNYGTCVSVFAPGLEITSTWIGSNTAINTISGTSMASPHVAGMAALYLQSYPTAKPAAIKSAFVTNASKNLIRMDCATGETACTKSPNVFVFSPCNP